MPLIQWRDDFTIGIPMVDHEHAALIGVINLLGERLDRRFGDKEIRQSLGEIRMLIAAHFANEERIMRDLRFAEYAAHKADHDRLLGEIAEIVAVAELPDIIESPDIAVGGIGGSGLAAPLGTSAFDWRVALGDRVGRWFARHFETFDARLHALADEPVARE